MAYYDIGNHALECPFVVQKLGLTVEKKMIMRLGTLDELLHRAHHISLGRYLCRVFRIVGEHDDILGLVTELPCQ